MPSRRLFNFFFSLKIIHNRIPSGKRVPEQLLFEKQKYNCDITMYTYLLDK